MDCYEFIRIHMNSYEFLRIPRQAPPHGDEAGRPWKPQACPTCIPVGEFNAKEIGSGKKKKLQKKKTNLPPASNAHRDRPPQPVQQTGAAKVVDTGAPPSTPSARQPPDRPRTPCRCAALAGTMGREAGTHCSTAASKAPRHRPPCPASLATAHSEAQATELAAPQLALGIGCGSARVQRELPGHPELVWRTNLGKLHPCLLHKALVLGNPRTADPWCATACSHEARLLCHNSKESLQQPSRPKISSRPAKMLP